jgi:hypothetical protein
MIALRTIKRRLGFARDMKSWLKSWKPFWTESPSPSLHCIPSAPPRSSPAHLFQCGHPSKPLPSLVGVGAQRWRFRAPGASHRGSISDSDAATSLRLCACIRPIRLLSQRRLPFHLCGSEARLRPEWSRSAGRILVSVWCAGWGGGGSPLCVPNGALHFGD